MNNAPRPNRDLRDEIRDYWSDRAEHFDSDPGHKITDGAERSAWQALFRRHLGAAEGRRLLDLASGTGEIAVLCRQLGFEVTGLDWSEPMLARARSKAPDVAFLQADAERTMLPDASFDVVVTRHLVWTLVDPAAAFAEWRRVLTPGGQLLLVDGDFVTRSWLARAVARFSPVPASHGMATRHQDILSRVHFAGGARADLVAALLAEAGFTDIRVDTRFGRIHRAQAGQFGWRKSLLRRSEHRYAIAARVPDGDQ
ncbi:Ubiquinone/menaquinone biosynthesis C-methylase UbiE [Palleronia marisminoris]|uniref:Demethylmenaquinone methyltransferase n=1 Tax=Palleronia marisminoris TaxID=315423 RepID=A0A1Y5TT65_9RHOB|nr:class I SAM-dependent methyltransferase [Palleronia marisminoris]SFH51523.1 Ubiquinone/menaquinone biosynthesis C-methylase UbiE [Palleronia marisminoris]SLN70946.1 Demethylmenaquinone methyltransferase [Palleronia marisminoris]